MENNQQNNEDLTNLFKLNIENIALKLDLDNLKELNSELLDSVKSLTKRNNEISHENSVLDYRLKELMKELEISDLKEIPSAIDGLKESARDGVFYKAEFKKVAEEKDWVYVNQFERLHWGDNYPSLKVFFDFLQERNCLKINWSYFANLMTYGNMDIINLTTGVLSKQDLGYLIYKVKSFFLSEYNGSTKRYNAIIKRKFSIDGKKLEDSFFDKYVRGYKSGIIPRNMKFEEINILIQNIARRYY